MPGVSGYGRVFDAANNLLAGLVAAYANPRCNPTLRDPSRPGQVRVSKPVAVPDLTYVSDGGEPSFPTNREVLVTGYLLAREGFPGVADTHAITAATGMTGELAAWVFRRSPMIEEDHWPEAADLTASAQVIYADLEIVTRGIILGVEPNGTMLGPAVRAAMPEVRSMGPMGGMTGFMVTVNVELT